MSSYISIKLDNPSVYYTPGSTLTGKVIAFLTKPKKVLNITLFAFGKETTSFHYQSVLPCESEKIFLEYNFLLWKPGNGNDEILAAGKHVYTFSFKIPLNCLPNFESEYGNIRYKIKAKMEMPFKFNLKCEEKFVIASVLFPTVINKTVEENFTHKFGNSSEVINLEIIIPKKHFVFGESIKLVVNTQNQSKSLIDAIETGINTKIKYKGKAADSWRGKYFEATETEDLNFLSRKNKLYVNINQNHYYKRTFELENIYPSIPDNLIDVQHSVFVSLFVKKNSISFSVTFAVPIKIYTNVQKNVKLCNNESIPAIPTSPDNFTSSSPFCGNQTDDVANKFNPYISHVAPPAYSEIDESRLSLSASESVSPPKYEKCFVKKF